MANSSSLSIALRPKARLLRTIGDELISSETVAVIELVKNAYDADATHVLINFEGPLEQGRGKIEVIDNGSGMSLDIITNAWMVPATSSKKKNKRSPIFNRRTLGEKGVGRFATSRLSNSVEIITRERGANDEIRALFDWSQFDDETKFLDDIEILWDVTEPDEIQNESKVRDLLSSLDFGEELVFQHGTILRIENLRTKWSKEQLTALKTGLSRLVSPFLKVNDFKIYLQLPEAFQELEGKIEAPETLERPHYRIHGDISADGDCSLTLSMFKAGEESREISQRLLQEKKSAPSCGAFQVDLRVWDLDPISLKEIVAEQQSTLTDVKRDLKTLSGVNIYRDDFRVFPYGEKGNDWLGLDLRRVQNPTMRVSNNQIVGYILISADKNPNLKDQSNREGLIAGDAYRSLQAIVVEILSILEAQRYASKRPRGSAETEQLEIVSSNKESLFGGFNFSTVRKKVLDKYADDKELIKVIDEQEKSLKREVVAVQETLSRYQRLATLGQLVDTILHDGRTPLFKIGSESNLGIKKITPLAKANQSLEVFKTKFQTIKEQSAVIGQLFKRIEPFGGRKRGRPKNLILEEVINETFSILEQEIERLDVKICLPKSQTHVTLERSEIQQVLINLLNNSLYWLSREETRKREISVTVSRNSSGIELIFSDSGPGIDPNFRTSIFEPYFSLKSEGVGLGLTIAGEIITEYYAGSLELIDEGPLPGATFKIYLNKRV